jgi:hypothetical protein
MSENDETLLGRVARIISAIYGQPEEVENACAKFYRRRFYSGRLEKCSARTLADRQDR